MLLQGLPFSLFNGGFKVSSGTVEWYISSYGTDFDNSGIASSVLRNLVNITEIWIVNDMVSGSW